MHDLALKRKRFLREEDRDETSTPRLARRAWWNVGVAAVGVVGGLVSSSDASRKAKHAAQDAQKTQAEIQAELKYQPIDLEKLKTDASALAAQNATQSLALERMLQPGVADTREGLQKRVASELALGGNLSPDVANQVAAAARTAGGASGIGGNSAPLTAALTGQTAQGLLQQRENNAFNLLQANPLPTAGLDPGSLASAEVAQNAAQNQFNLAKAGVATNMSNSQAQLQGASAGANASMWNGIISGISGLASRYGRTTTTPTTVPGATYSGSVPAYQAPSNMFDFTSSIPQVSQGNIYGTCWVAREVYGVEDGRWLLFREWLLTAAPTWFRNLYISRGEKFALWLKDYPRIKSLIRVWMDSRIHGA